MLPAVSQAPVSHSFLSAVARTMLTYAQILKLQVQVPQASGFFV